MQGEAALDAAMSRLADGDRSAFDELYVALHPRAVSLARHRLGRDGDVEDVAQRTLMRVFAHANEFRRGASVLPWFYAIAANEVRRTVREARRASRSPNGALELAEVADATPSAEDRVYAEEIERALAFAIESLDDDAARAIASLLGDAAPLAVSPATLRKRISRAYVKLRALMGRLDVG